MANRSRPIPPRRTVPPKPNLRQPSYIEIRGPSPDPNSEGGGDGSGDPTQLFAITAAQDATGTIDGTPVLTVDGATGIVRISVNDAAALRVGEGDEIRIGRDATNSWVYNTSGQLNLGTSVATHTLFRTNGVIRGYVAGSGGWVIGGAATIASGAVLDVQTTDGTALTVSDSTRIVSVHDLRITGTSTNVFVGGDAGLANTTGVNNSFFGQSAGKANTTGDSNSFFGRTVGVANTTGSNNSFFGREAGAANTTGANNCFFGRSAGIANTTASNNSFFGWSSGAANTTGFNNSFFGQSAGLSNTTGVNNSFFGLSAGAANTTGGDNSFFGLLAGNANTTGSSNSFFGRSAGLSNNTGVNNSFFGWFAGAANTTGGSNSFFGRSAGDANTTGSNNCFFGYVAGAANTIGGNNAFFGWFAGSATTGSNNTFFGRGAGQSNTTGTYNIAIGSAVNCASATASNQLNIGNWITGAAGAIAIGSAALQAGSRFEVQTTDGLALRVADDDRTLHLPWDGTSTSPNFAIGASDDLLLFHDGNSWMRNQTGELILYQNSTSDVKIVANNATSGNIRFYTRGAGTAQERCRVSNNGLQLIPVASDPGSPANGDIWVTAGGDLKFRANGTTYTVTKT